MDIHEFRDFINSFHSGFVQDHWKDVDGKDYWSGICSAMDWLTEACSVLTDCSSRMLSSDAGWRELYAYLSCVDVILEATEQLHRFIYKTQSRPEFANKILQTRPSEYAELTDRDFFKELRAAFGAHSVNYRPRWDERLGKEEKRFASWVVKDHAGTWDFYVRLYSNIIGEKDVVFGVKLTEVMAFCRQYQGHLVTLQHEIERVYGQFRNEMAARKIERGVDPILQWAILEKEAKERNLGLWIPLVMMNEILSATSSGVRNAKLLSDYRQVVFTVLEATYSAFQGMDECILSDMRARFEDVLAPPYVDDVSYYLGKFFSQELPYEVVRTEFARTFGRWVDLESTTSDSERRVLILAVLYFISQERKPFCEASLTYHIDLGDGRSFEFTTVPCPSLTCAKRNDE